MPTACFAQLYNDAAGAGPTWEEALVGQYSQYSHHGHQARRQQLQPHTQPGASSSTCMHTADSLIVKTPPVSVVARLPAQA